ncbi:MAG: hybrid sensor histidine kinase/response regulator, partial [Burkholderiales bacterium]|nr:hybrid sensor histidine kinase/response regulator [Burkholderiales bacterium]
MRARREAEHPGLLGPDLERYDELRLQVLFGFTSALRWQMVAVGVVVTGVAIDGGCPAPIAGAWLGVMLLVREARAADLRRLAADRSRPIAQRLRRLALGSLALGLTHGAPALAMLVLDRAHAAIVTMILMSLTAGTVSTSFTVTRAFVAYVAAISVPTALVWFWIGGWLGWSTGLLALMFLGVQLRFARQNLQMFEASYRIRLENTELLRDLSAERSRLAQARDAAVQADQAKSRFLAAASHDLRQPLHGLALNSGALARLPLAGEAREIAAEMSAAIEALRQMLDALLDISQLDGAGRAPGLEPIRLDRLLDVVCAGFRAAAEAKGLGLRHEGADGLVVHSSPKDLRRILANLLDNAIKFTTAGAVVLTARPEGAQVLLTVRDSGCGIDPAQHQRVFEDLEQLGNPHRDRARGHGLGLGIVRRLARLLGIECTIESTLGAGTAVHLRLPGADGVLPIVSQAGPSVPSLVARRVLVLDDDQAVREAYGHALRGLGCRVACTGSLDEALAALDREAPEVALVDYRLAGPCDGLQAIDALRQRRPGLAAIVVSADVSPALHGGAAARGA